MQVYIAGPFFTSEERSFLQEMISFVKNTFPNYNLFIPMEHFVPNGEQMTNNDWAKAVYDMDIKALHDSDCVVALYLGHYSDTGTAFEIGYGLAIGKPVYLYIPEAIKHKDMSIMPLQGCAIINSVDRNTLNQK